MTDDLITGVKHPAVAATRADLAGGRDAAAFLVDGRRLVTRAIEARAAVRRVFLLDPVDPDLAPLREAVAAAGVTCLRVRRGVFFKLLGLGYETSVRVLAVVDRPRPADVTRPADRDACVLVGERIQDPRNVGVMVRTAEGFGLPAAVFSADSADPWCRAAVRSSTGSILRLPLGVAVEMPGYLSRLKRAGFRVIGSSAAGSTLCRDADLGGRCALLLGNESDGLSAEARRLCDAVVSIPLPGGAHSYNVTVAAGILLYERARRG